MKTEKDTLSGTNQKSAHGLHSILPLVEQKEEITKWREIFKEYDEAVGKKTKPKTDNQIRTWLQNPHSDSAEYKMWGNGVSLPVVFFVLSGIKWAVDENIGRS